MKRWKVPLALALVAILMPAILSVFIHSDVRRAKQTAHTGPVLLAGAKERLIGECPSYAYTEGRHDLYPTPDIPVHEIPWLDLELQPGISRILEKIASVFRVSIDDLWLRDLFLVRYTPSGQRGLEEHTDVSIFSFIIQISDLVAGEGTLFSDTGRLERAEPGHAIAFCGARKHRGVELRSAVPRVIVAGFVDVVPGMRPGFLAANPWIEQSSGTLHRPYLLWNLRKMESETGLEAAALASAIVDRRYLPEQAALRFGLGHLRRPPSDTRDLSGMLSAVYNSDDIYKGAPRAY